MAALRASSEMANEGKILRDALDTITIRSMKTFILMFLAAIVSAQAATLNVPRDHRTVQAAVDAAQPGDVVLISNGVYNEAVKTVRGGVATGRITIDGQNAATIRQFIVGHPYITLKNCTVSGSTSLYSAQVEMKRGGHFTRIENCVIDCALAPKVYGIQWSSASTMPFGTDAASDCVITGSTIQRVFAITMISMTGDRNIVEKCRLLDSGQVDFFRLWGRNNRISGNLCQNNYEVTGQGNHPDFIQTFGNNGEGSQGHIIENNIVRDAPGAQVTQLEGNLMSEIGNWTFRNNIFINVGLGASCSIPNVKYFNNVFYRGNKVNGGHALNFGSRYYEAFSVHAAHPLKKVLETPVPSGGLVQGNNYIVNLNGNTGGYVTYDGVQRGDGKSFFATATTTYQKTHAGITVNLRLPNVANGAVVKNNVFMDCGDPTSLSKGWYAFDTDLKNVSADYNYVAKAGFVPMREDLLKRAIGNAGGWDFQRWYEPNGINGGDPKWTNLGALNFTPMAGSLLIDRGTHLVDVRADLRGTVRPQGIAVDIGPYEFGDEVLALPAPPRGLRVVNPTD